MKDAFKNKPLSINITVKTSRIQYCRGVGIYILFRGRNFHNNNIFIYHRSEPYLRYNG